MKALSLRARARAAKLEWLGYLRCARVDFPKVDVNWKARCIERALFYRALQRVYGGYK